MKLWKLIFTAKQSIRFLLIILVELILSFVYLAYKNKLIIPIFAIIGIICAYCIPQIKNFSQIFTVIGCGTFMALLGFFVHKLLSLNFIQTRFFENIKYP